MIGGTNDVSPEELADVWEQNWVGPLEQIERIRAIRTAASHDGVDLAAASPLAEGLPGLIRKVREVDDTVLCTAVAACAKASSVLAAVMMQRSPDDPEVLETLVGDVMWEQWGRVHGIAPVNGVGEAAIAMSTVQHLVIPGWAEDLRRYRGRLENLMTVSAAAYGSGAAGDGAPIEAP
jgi:threonine synthase